MLYHVSRGSQSYGPYTLEDLQRYVASGNVLPTDLAKSEEMAEWTPVAQIIGMPAPAAPPPYAPYAPQAPGMPYGQPYAQPMATGIYPDAPNLSWGLVLLFAILTCSLFMFVWNLIVSAWMKRAQPNSTAVIFYAIATGLFVVQGILGSHVHVQVGDMATYYRSHAGTGLLGLVVWVLRLIARFTMRSNLEEHFNGPEPVGLQLSGVMTFFFGGLYFQYHLTRINEMKRIARYRGAAI